MLITLEEAANCLGLQIPDNADASAFLRKCVTDSRLSVSGCIFACITGENNDGHDYAKSAVKNGASLILAEKDIPDPGAPVFLVNNVIEAMCKLASFWRSKTNAYVIAVTGTAGKTTLKDTLAAILSRAGKTGFSSKNHNNQLGLSCSIMDMDGDEEFWILEAGISHQHDMDELGAMIRPDLAIIINAGPGHCEGLGGKGVAWHKSRLLAYVSAHGKALVSADYPELLEHCEDYDIARKYFSLKNKSDYYLSESKLVEGEYVFQWNNGQTRVKTPFYGLAGAEIAGMAVACANMLDLSPDQIQNGLDAIKLPEQRFQIMDFGNIQIIDDTYNANPLSMERMIQTANLVAKSNKSRLVTVLGQMGELGDASSFWHEELGKLLALTDPYLIFWKGDHYADVKEGYLRNKGYGDIFLIDAPNEINRLRSVLASGDNFLVLFKGSRSNKMEEVLNNFLQKPKNSGEGNVL